MGKDFGSYGARANAVVIAKNIINEYGISSDELFGMVTNNRQPMNNQRQNEGFSNQRQQPQRQGFSNIRRTNGNNGYGNGYQQNVNQGQYNQGNRYASPNIERVTGNEEFDTFNLNEPLPVNVGDVDAEMRGYNPSYRSQDEVDINQVLSGPRDSRPQVRRK